LVSETGPLCYLSAQMPLSLVYHAGALGDFLTTLPAMSVWRRLHARDRITLLGVPGYASLAPDGLFNELWDARSSQFASLFAGGTDSASPLGFRLSPFHSALLFSSLSSGLAANLSRLGVKEIVRQDPFPSRRMHIVDYHLSLFPGNVLTEEDRLPRVSRPQGSLSVPPDAVAVHPGSGDRQKNWPVSSFAGLVAGLEQSGFPVRWIIGPGEEDLALPPGAQAWRNISLTELAAALAACRLFVGNDSGVSHLAAATGCATVALFGATDPVVWAPRGRSTRIIQKAAGTLSSLSVETVLSECLGLLRR
jgi:Glycosyltransferase family 9 (heptosyltransferase)